MKRWLLRLLLIPLFTLAAYACESVKPYQRVYLNDHEMLPGYSKAGRMEENMQNYREGASGGAGMKTSGGCGCN